MNNYKIMYFIYIVHEPKLNYEVGFNDHYNDFLFHLM